MSVDGPPASGSMPHLQEASLVGEVLDGRYRILSKLGEGGMGEVYAAEHVHIEKRFAIKLLRPEIVSNPEAVSRFRQEARSSSSIGHRNIIAIEDFGQLADNRIYMCMELLNGAALNDLIMTPQPVDRLLNILIQTGHGLAAAHAKNIVHRDMKPENIFVTIGPNNEDIPKILDFGIAKVAGNDGQNNLTRTGTIFGTPFYMAPEQALGNPVDARTDIYAMGVIMYEVFAGSLPFQGESFMGILTQHITTEPEPVAQRAQRAERPLPPGLADVITRCMQKNPAQRFATMDELVNALIQIYRGIAGAGMSTYMEAFPVSAAHPVPTPMTGAVPIAAATSATVAAVSPTGQGYAPTGQAPQVGPSGGYAGASSSVVTPAKKSSAGLIIAIFAVLAVGGGITALVLTQGDDKPGDGSGSQLASGDTGSSGSGSSDTTNGSGTTTNGSGTTTNGSGTTTNGSATTTNGSATTTNGSATGSGDGSSGTGDGSGSGTGSDAGSGSVATNGSGSGSDTVTAAPDAGVEAPAAPKIMVVVNGVPSFEIYEGKDKIADGPGEVELPATGTRKLVLKAKNFRDKTITLDAKKDAKKSLLQLSMTKIPSHNTNTTPPPPRCTGTAADMKNPDCRAKYCAPFKDRVGHPCSME